jgi:peptidoglycan-associated lipoprotein
VLPFAFLGGVLLVIVALAGPGKAEGEHGSASPAEGIVADFRSEAGDRVFFAEGSAALGARAGAALDAQAAWLRKHPDLAVTVEGYADDIGSRRDNFRIARRRAAAVRGRLILRGVAAERIATVAFGRTHRAAACAEAACSAHNRRSITVPVAQRRAGGVAQY